jgi:hypothetical protein
MNQIKLSLRTADDPRTIKEEAGLPYLCVRLLAPQPNQSEQGR